VIDMSDASETAEAAVRLSVAIKRLRARLREEAGVSRSGFTISQLAILHRVIVEGPVTAATMAAAEHVSQQAIAQSVATLKEAGLVQGARDAADARKVLISATAAGVEMYETLSTSRKEWLARAIDTVVGPGERRDLDVAIELLERLAGADLGPELR
jgi:DNA-binding MarR family transcriptional regulator